MGTSRSASQTSSGGSKEPVVVEQRRYVRHDGVDPLRGNRVLSGGAAGERSAQRQQHYGCGAPRAGVQGMLQAATQGRVHSLEARSAL